MASCCCTPFHELLSCPGTGRKRCCGLHRSFLLPTSAAQSADKENRGFRTCTESLGFESSDERMMDERDETAEKRRSDDGEEKGRSLMRKTEVKKRVGTTYPPPLPGFDLKGRTRSFMKAERGDGMLRLTEVRVERPEILRASREGGRLRLQVVVGRPPPIEDADEEEHEHEEAEEEKMGRWQHGFQRCHREEGYAAAICLRGAHVA